MCLFICYIGSLFFSSSLEDHWYVICARVHRVFVFVEKFGSSKEAIREHRGTMFPERIIIKSKVLWRKRNFAQKETYKRFACFWMLLCRHLIFSVILYCQTLIKSWYSFKICLFISLCILKRLYTLLTFSFPINELSLEPVQLQS